MCFQTCIGRIVDCIEARARDGFRCTIGGHTMLCFPRLGVMSLDTPERVKYFGLRSKQACAICRKRKGSSAFRDNVCHQPNHISELYATANGEAHTRERISARKRARESLERHGFNSKRRCTVTDHAKHCLVCSSTWFYILSSTWLCENASTWFLNTRLRGSLICRIRTTPPPLTHAGGNRLCR